LSKALVQFHLLSLARLIFSSILSISKFKVTFSSNFKLPFVDVLTVLPPHEVGFDLLEFQSQEQDRINSEQDAFSDMEDEEISAFEAQIEKEKAEGAIFVEKYEKLRKAEEDALLARGEKVHGRVGSVFNQESQDQLISEIKSEVGSSLVDDIVNDFMSTQLMELESEAMQAVSVA
jgi:hypothetical protein